MDGRFGMTASFDGMAWPLASDEAIGEVEYRLRHGGASKQDLMIAATVMAAYSQMVYDPERKRRHVIAKLREIAEMPDQNIPTIVQVCCFQGEHYRWFDLPKPMTKYRAARWALETLGMPAEDYRAEADGPAAQEGERP